MEISTRARPINSPKTPEARLKVKNIMINYFTAIRTFILKGLADPYLRKEFVGVENLDSFKDFIYKSEKSFKSLEGM